MSPRDPRRMPTKCGAKPYRSYEHGGEAKLIVRMEQDIPLLSKIDDIVDSEQFKGTKSEFIRTCLRMVVDSSNLLTAQQMVLEKLGGSYKSFDDYLREQLRSGKTFWELYEEWGLSESITAQILWLFSVRELRRAPTS